MTLRKARQVLTATIALMCGGLSYAQVREVYPYPDDSVIARDALPGALELSRAGRFGESVRVLQSVLDSQAENVMESDEPRLYVTVRERIHELLRSNPELLRRYREISEPQARVLSDSGDYRAAERSYLMTPSGFRGATLLAREHIENARFDSARLLLEQLNDHPDLAEADNRRIVAELATLCGAYIPRPEVLAWIATLRERASMPATEVAPVQWPETLTRPWRSPLVAQPSTDFAAAGDSPLKSERMDIARAGDDDDAAATARNFRDFASKEGKMPWVMPSVRGDTLYINDGLTVSAFDHATLALKWRVKPAGGADRALGRDLNTLSLNSWKGLEDIGTVTLRGDMLFAATGTPAAGVRTGDRRIHAIHALTGEIIWSVDPNFLDPIISDASVRGPLNIEGDTVVATMRRPGGANRTIGLYAVGLDAGSGSLRWVRHLGSIGSVTWSRQQSRPEGAVSDAGIVYRTDEMGLIAAIDASNGRPRWVRLVSSGRTNEGAMINAELPPPYEINIPILADGRLTVIDPSGGAIVQYDARNGRLIATRRITEAGSRDIAFAPEYMIRAGDRIAVICRSAVVTLPLADIEKGELKIGTAFDGEFAPVGRATYAGGFVLMPVREGLMRIDPESPKTCEVVKISRSGNIVIAGDSQGTHPVVVDGSGVHTYLRWETARDVLESRLSADPSDPRPLLTYIELAARAGKADLVPSLADRILAIVRDSSGFKAAATSAELFDLLLSMIRAGREQSVTPDDFGSFKPVSDPKLIDALVTRLGLSGEEPAKQVEYLFELAILRESQKRSADAVEALQRILNDATLSQGRVGTEAASRLISVLRRNGYRAYALFDAQAAQEIGELPADSDAAAMVELAAKYPAADAAPELLARAGEWRFAREDREGARESFGKALVIAETGHAIGRSDMIPRIDAIARRLLEIGAGAGRVEACERLRSRLVRTYPELRTLPVNDARSELGARRRAPRVGDQVGAGIQVITGWSPVETVLTDVAGRSGDCVAMINDSARRIALFGSDLATDALEPLWQREITKVDPTVLCVLHDAAYLFWPASGGGEIECVSSLTGETLWRTKEFGTLFEDTNGIAGQRIRSPMDQDVGAEDFQVIARQDALIFVQVGSGRIASFSMKTGEINFKRASPVSRVFEMTVVGSQLLIGGLASDGESKSRAALVSLDLATGADRGSVSSDTLGDHVRWIRAVSGDEAIVATSDSIMRINAATGEIKWSHSGPLYAMTGSGWIVGERAYVTDESTQLRTFLVNDGVIVEEPLETRARLGYPLRGRALDGNFLLSSTSGVLIFGPDASLIGADMIAGPAGKIHTPVLADGRIVMLEVVDGRENAFGAATPGTVKLHVLDMNSAKLIRTRALGIPDTSVYAVQAVDGKVIVSLGAATVVYSLP